MLLLLPPRSPKAPSKVSMKVLLVSEFVSSQQGEIVPSSNILRDYDGVIS